ncbi:MAG: carnitine dehydratase [Rhodospirillaceae bacterium]|nr:carnitine dehydratase [Rhodospirillaceae bacterium]
MMGDLENLGPLSGVRVVDLTINVLGPVATQILGDMGAEVIKVETPAGDPMRLLGPSKSREIGPFFQTTNRNKKSVVLDLKRGEAKAALDKLVGTADVFVHNMRHAAAKRLSIDFDSLRAVNPRLVYGYATGYRKGGPKDARPAYDDVIQGESGIVDLIERANGEARFVPMPISDKFCGYVLASSIAMALYRRERTGVGQEVHVPMLETMLSMNLITHLWRGTQGDKSNLGYPRALSPHRVPYQTSDGMLCVLAHTDDQWHRLLRAVDRADLIEEPKFKHLAERSENIVELQSHLARALAELTTAEAFRRLDEADLPNGPVTILDGVMDDPYLTETGFFQTFDDMYEGTVVTTAVPVSFSESPGSLRMMAPALGEHTEQILSEIGVASRDIAALAE